MKRYEIYKNIRKQAVIFGLPLTLFALMIFSVVASLMVIIFSFSFKIVIAICILNIFLYYVLLRITINPQIFETGKKFPKMISNKRNSSIDYE